MTKNTRIAVLTVLLVVAVGLLLTVGEPTIEERDANAALDKAYKAGDFKAAVELATKHAKKGNVHAQVILGTLYRKGEGVAADFQEAAHWYGLAAAQGDAYAQNMRGEMFLRGEGLRPDRDQALVHFRKAARQGLKQAKLNLCGMYYREEDVGTDYVRAVRKLRMQAHMANSLGPYEMGRMFMDGSVTQDYSEAARWFLMSARQGMPKAQVELGELYEQGLGVPQDYVMAHVWFNVAASKFSDVYSDGERRDASRRRDAVAAKMTPAQVADAQVMAREWRPTPWETLMGRQIVPSE